jgi:hypothetical protein
MYDTVTVMLSFRPYLSEALAGALESYGQRVDPGRMAADFQVPGGVIDAAIAVWDSQSILEVRAAGTSSCVRSRRPLVAWTARVAQWGWC